MTIRIHGEEKRGFERNIIEKYKEPKLFCNYMNSKMRQTVGSSKLKVGGKVYKEAMEQADIMKKSFEKFFLMESDDRKRLFKELA